MSDLTKQIESVNICVADWIGELCMSNQRKGFCILLFCIMVVTSCITPLCAYAQEDSAIDITENANFTGSSYQDYGFLTDKNTGNYKKSAANGTITIESANDIGSIYLMFDLEYDGYQITDNETGTVVTAGENSFLHEYVDLANIFGSDVNSITITFSSDPVSLSEIYVFSPGKAPSFIQQWNASLDGKADMVLFSTHADDDQLFFAGLLPLYAGARNYAVQVVYLTDHRNLTNGRTHELLNGLWAVGVRAYPVWGTFADFRIDDLEKTYQKYESYNVSREDLLEFVVKQLRRFRPQVAIGHDINGEYGHGMHMVYTDLLIKALDISNDPEAFPDLTQQYGTWQVPKTYLHLYDKNPILLNYDTPLSEFNGMTAFQVSQKMGYPCHKSQQYTWFTRWINGNNGEITNASQIGTYSPCQFGLYRSNVGDDVLKNDFMENIISYAEQERIEEEKQLEEEKRKEEERLEQERQQEEERRRQEEEQKRLEAEKAEQEAQRQQEALEKALMQQQQKERRMLYAAILLLIMSLAGLILLPKMKYRNSSKK